MEILKTIQALQSIGDCKEIDDAVALIVQQGERIAELEAQNRWIPVTERLPEAEAVLATDGENLYLANGNWFYKSPHGKIRIPANYGSGADVTHWMPLPEPPKEDTK